MGTIQPISLMSQRFSINKLFGIVGNILIKIIINILENRLGG